MGSPSGAQSRPARIFFVNRYFAPDVSATSQILSDLAFHLAARGREVHVVCGDTLYEGGPERLPAEEMVGGVSVHRVPGGRFSRASLVGRAMDYVGLYASLRRRLVGLLRAGDIVVAKTDPPLLSVPLAGVAGASGATFVPWLQDLYPEVAIALGVPMVAGRAGKALTALRNRSLRRARAVVAIGDGMRDLLIAQGVDAQRISVIPNWSDDAAIMPLHRDANPLRAQWGLTGKFVIGYSGNLGRAHEHQTLLDAAERLRDHTQLVFLFIGGGHHVETLQRELTTRGLEHLFAFRPYQDRANLSQSLSAPDVHWISLRPELEGLIVPSKFYGVAAAGRPVINVASPDGEIAKLLQRHRAGMTIRPGDDAGLASAILHLSRSADDLEEMGRRSHAMLRENYSKACAMVRWEGLLASLS